MKRWTLVTGGAGYVGSVLVPLLLASGRNVRVLDSLLHGSVPSLLGSWSDRQFEFVRGDVRDEEALRAALADAKEVVHLAAVVGDPACARDPDEANAVNFEATKCVLDGAEASGVERFLFASTCSNYGNRDVLVNGSVVVYGEQFWRPYVHVYDAARAFATVLDAPTESVAGEVYNVGSSAENYRKLDIVELLRERVPTTKVEFVQKDEDPRDYRVSFDKFEQVTGFHVSRGVADGIDEVARLLKSGLLEDPFAAAYRN